MHLGLDRASLGMMVREDVGGRGDVSRGAGLPAKFSRLFAPRVGLAAGVVDLGTRMR
jgi:hypothetical protein